MDNDLERHSSLKRAMRVLMITSEWPTPQHPERAPFIVQQVNHLRQAGVAVEVFAFRGRKNPLNYWQEWRKVRRQFDMKHFDIVHAQFGQSGLLALPAARPLVVTFRGSDLQGFVGANGRYTVAGYLLQMVSQWVARRADEIVVVSRQLAGLLPPRLPVHVIPSGINFDLFRPMPQAPARRQLGLPPDKRLVLFAADPQNPIKRFSLAESAVAQVRSEFDVDLVVMRGVPHSLVPAYMNACDVLLLTSANEGSPNVVKEALACNLPVVAVAVGDVRQRLGRVAGCVVCPDDSPATIARGLAAVLRFRRRTCGRETIEDLDERIVAQRLIHVYRAALARYQ